MTSDDWKRLLLGPTLFRLDTVISTRLVPILYSAGLLAVLVWAIDHLFLRFESGFGNGLWGLIEIAVFGLIAVIVLRIACEAVLVYFRSHEADADAVSRTRLSTSLLEEVKDALHDLAEADEDEITISEPVHVPPTPRPPPPPAPRPAAEVAPLITEPIKRSPPVRRTAKRSPRPKPAAPETKS